MLQTTGNRRLFHKALYRNRGISSSKAGFQQCIPHLGSNAAGFDPFLKKDHLIVFLHRCNSLGQKRENSGQPQHVTADSFCRQGNLGTNHLVEDPTISHQQNPATLSIMGQGERRFTESRLGLIHTTRIPDTDKPLVLIQRLFQTCTQFLIAKGRIDRRIGDGGYQ